MIRALIIEEEAPLRELLKMQIRETGDDVEIVATCEGIASGLEAIARHKPDLIFLDVIMPGGTGFDVLENLPFPCEVIFITAHESFAIEAFKHAAVGYVLKPVDKDDLRTAVNNARKRLKTAPQTPNPETSTQTWRMPSVAAEKIALPTTDGFLFVKAEDVIRCEGDKMYSWIYLQDGKKILTSYCLGEFKRILPETVFIQVHKSHIVSLHYVCSLNGKENTLQLADGSCIPLSRRNKNQFLNHFKIISRQGDE